TWTWVSGNDTRDKPGIYGTQGVADPANVPGARDCSISWTDAGGNFWLFGGCGLDDTINYGDLNDLWRFNVSDATWTWVSGNDTRDKPGIYGTQGVADPANVPGARDCSISWTDAGGNFWLFGGCGLDDTINYGDLNDLWRFNVSDATWTWVSGNDTRDKPGIYGTQGVADPANVPGARERSVSWTDAGDNFWLFGGGGYDNATNYGDLNDLWRFNVSDATWTWVSGNYSLYNKGIYGTLGVADPANVPGARELSASWTDASSNLWLFGGYGIDNVSFDGDLNDLWKYTP
ncbi:MAG: hypothetical protein EAX96_18355, partial [Candidatus Lokiarchaeota archaeon]|nr:hypothetical protein [Candidatus Lokiarchaeota archaeon]